MESTRWERVLSLFHQAVELPEATREAFLDGECGPGSESRPDSDGIKAEVLNMLRADGRHNTFLDGGLPGIASRIVTSAEDAIPVREIGPYHLVRLLGEGGMGVVWLARRDDTGSLAAIKFLPNAALSPSRRERFAREIKTLAKLRHPYIARLYDAGTLADGTPWFVMEYVEGQRLTQYCEERALSIDQRLRLLRKVCEAVQYAHSREIIHRDLKPSNIFVEEDGNPRLLDFGIARELQSGDDASERTQLGLRFFSPSYAAPEWRRDGTVGFFTDVYSLGVVLYELLTGRLPYPRPINGPGSTSDRGSSGSGQIDSLQPPPKPSSIAIAAGIGEALGKTAWSDLDMLCLKALRADPNERYQSIEALARDLDHYLHSEPLEAQPDSFNYRLGKFLKRNRRPVLAASLTLAAAIAMVVFFTVRLTKARDAALAEAARTQRIQQFMMKLFAADDPDAGPSDDLKVVTLVDRGAEQAKRLGADPDIQAELYRNLATVYDNLGKPDRADSLLQAALREHRGMPKPDQRQVAQDLVSLGQLRSEQERAKEGEPLIREGIAMLERQRPVDQAMLADGTSALGEVLIAEGNYKQAAAVLDTALRLQAERDSSSVEMGDTLGLMSMAQLYMGHYDASESLSLRSLAIDRKAYGDNHPSIAADYINLSELEEQWGRYKEAERYERQALAITQSWRGPEHPDTLRQTAHLAKTLYREGKNDEAAALLEKTIGAEERTLGRSSQTVAYTLITLGNVDSAKGKTDAAESEYRRAIEIYRTALGPDNYKSGAGIAALGGLFLETKRYGKAETLFRQVLQIYGKSLPSENIDIGQVEIQLGRAVLHQNRPREAEPHTLAGYRILMKQPSPDTSFVEGARKDLANIYAALNQLDKAREFQTEATNAQVASARPPR